MKSDSRPVTPKRGFQTFSPAQLKAVSRKGGKAKVSKGFASLSKEELSELGRQAALKRWNKRKEQEHATEEDSVPGRDVREDQR